MCYFRRYQSSPASHFATRVIVVVGSAHVVFKKVTSDMLPWFTGDSTVSDRAEGSQHVYT